MNFGIDALRKNMWIMNAAYALLTIGYIMLYFGIYWVDKRYVKLLSVFVHVVICFYLLIRFNFMSTKTVVVNWDEKQMIASAAGLLLFNIIFYDMNNVQDIPIFGKFLSEWKEKNLL